MENTKFKRLELKKLNLEVARRFITQLINMGYEMKILRVKNGICSIVFEKES